MNSNRHILKEGTRLHGKDYVYEIENVLGQGSFGITYLAKVCLKGSLGVIQGNIYVAIKEFYMVDVNSRVGTRVDSGTESGLFNAYHSRFQKEALNLARMNHPGIVKVMEVFDENNTSYMVMEYLEGGTLDGYINKKKTIPENEATTIITQIAQALSYMHDRQMLHLDLKPGNIMLRKDKQPVLIDFGLSKHYNENGIPETSTPIGLGTPGYAPLEQSEYQESDGFQPTMDIYALGATLFKMLTGLATPTAASVLNRPSMLNDLMIAAGITQMTRDLVLSAMQPLRKARPQSVQAFLDKMVECSDVAEYNDESTLVENTYNSSQNELYDRKRNQGQPTEQNVKVESDCADDIPRVENSFDKEESFQQPVSQTNDSEFYTLEFNDTSRIYMSRYGTRYMCKEDLLIEEGFASIKYKDKWGIADKEGKLVVPFMYENVYSGNSMMKNGKWGMVIKDTNQIIPCLYDESLKLVEEYIVACKKGLYGVIDKHNRTVIPFKYKKLYCFSEGLLAAMNEKGLWGYINVKDEVIIPFNYQDTYRFIEGKAAVRYDNKWGLIDIHNRWIIPNEYEELWSESYKGLHPAKKNGFWGFIDESGKKNIDFIYSSVSSFKEELAVVIYKNQKADVINIDGRPVTPNAFDKIERISDISFRVVDKNKQGIMIGNGYMMRPCIFSDLGHFNEGVAYIEMNGKMGFIDEGGKEVLPLIYDWVAPQFISGKILVRQGTIHYQIDKTGKILNTFHNLTVHEDCIYSFMADWNGKWGFIDYKGDVLVPFVYDEFLGCWKGLVLTRKGDKYGFLDEYTHREIIAPSYDFVDEQISEDLVAVSKDGKYGFINEEAEFVIPLTAPSKTSGEKVLRFKNNIAAIGNKFFDRDKHKIMVFNPKITYSLGVVCVLAIIMTVVLLVIYSNSHTLHKALPTVGLWIGHIKKMTLNLIGHIGFKSLIVLAFLSALCCISQIYYRFKVLTYPRAYRAQEIVKKRILDSYDDYAYLMTCGLLAVKKEDKWGFINKQGEVVIPFRYDWVSVFKRRRAKVILDNEEMTINTKGKRISN